MDTINETRAMNIGNNAEEVDNLTSAYIPASLYHDELMEIYMIPFVLVVIYSCLGIIGNSIVLFIYISKMKKTKSRIFFITLAIFNFVNSAFDMPLEAYMLSHPLQYDNHWLCKMQKGVNFTINNVCACVFVAIAVDRLLLVFKPLYRSNVLTVAYAKIACVIAFVVGTATAWPGFVFYGTATQHERVRDIVVTGKMCFVSDYFIKNAKWPSLFGKYLFILMITVFAMLSIMYLIIGKKIYDVTRCDLGEKKKFGILKSIRKIAITSIFTMRGDKVQNVISDEGNNERNEFETKPKTSKNNKRPKANKGALRTNNFPRYSRRHSSVNAGASRGSTITLALITGFFIMSFLPYCVIVSLRNNDKQFYFDLNESSRIAYHVFLRFYFLNSVFSPIIYSFFNKEFRNTLIQLIKEAFNGVRARLLSEESSLSLS